MSEELKGLPRGPGFLVKWSDQVAATVNANKPLAGCGTSTSDSPAGTAINVGPPPTQSDSNIPPGGGSGGGGGDDGSLLIADDDGNEVDDVTSILFHIAAAGDGDAGDVVSDDGDGAGEVCLGVSQQFYLVVEGALKTINLLADPTVNGGEPEDA